MRFSISILGTEVIAFDLGNYVLVEASEDQDAAPAGIASGSGLVSEQPFIPRHDPDGVIEASGKTLYGFGQSRQLGFDG